MLQNNKVIHKSSFDSNSLMAYTGNKKYGNNIIIGVNIFFATLPTATSNIQEIARLIAGVQDTQYRFKDVITKQDKRMPSNQKFEKINFY